MARVWRTLFVSFLVIGASAVALPVASAGASATVAVDVKETLAGAQETYAFTLTNTSGSNEDPINHARSEPQRERSQSTRFLPRGGPRRSPPVPLPSE